MTARTGTTQGSASPFESFATAVRAAAPAHSRRDLLRAAAIIGATATTLAAPIRAAASPGGRRPAPGAWLQDSEVQSPVTLDLPLNPFGQPVTLDPHRTVNWGPFWVLLPYVFSGLLRFDENGGVVADLAESVEPQGDASVWRATLKSDLDFASGRRIVAEDFVGSWRRALDPQAISPMATFMSNVLGFQDYTTGASTDLGVTAVDERTIEIQLTQPDSSFPSSLATFVWAVVDLDTLAASDADDPALANAGAGAWRVTEFVDGERVVMDANPEYWDEPSPSITRIDWHILDGADASALALERYRAGDLAVADVPLSALDTVQGDEALAAELVTVESQASTLAIGLDFNQAPFNDVRVRQAVAAAIDRDAWATDIWRGGFVPASAFIPPVVTLTSDYEPASLPSSDANPAEFLAAAGIDPATDAPDIVYYQPATDSADDIERHAALLTMIEDVSGLVIRHDTALTREQIAARQRDSGGRQFDIVWWWTVTETAALLDTAVNPDSPAMRGWFNWSAELEATEGSDPGSAAAAFQERIAEARAATDDATRNAAFREAEQLMLDQAVYIPLGHWVQRFVQKPWLLGTRQGPWSGSLPARIDADVVVRGRDNGASILPQDG